MPIAIGLLSVTLAALAAPSEPAVAAPPAPPPATEEAAPGAAPEKKTKADRPRAVAPPRASLPTAVGTIVAIDHGAHRLTLRTPTGEVALSFDRNTFVRGPAGASSLLEAAPGQAARVGHDGAHRATWVELGGSAPPSTPAPTP